MVAQADNPTAIDQALMLDPRNLRALLRKADHLAQAGDARAASSFYAGVVAMAARSSSLPPDLAAEVRRAQAMTQHYATRFASELGDRLAAQGYDPVRSSRRFSQSLEIMNGQRQIYQQQPQVYYFPELPQIQFYDRADFPWTAGMEAATADIREELLAVMADDSAFTPYVTHVKNRAQKAQQGMLDNPSWSSFFLVKDGEVQAGNAARCPRTMAALSAVPSPRIAGRTPTILFSLLRPGARIPPHTGFVNTRLICHLPLIVPEKCGFRVGNETREWVEGEVMVFDDTIEHEAWNLSDQTRVILLFDIWRPELSEEERGLVAAMFTAIDADGPARAWSA